MAANFSDPEWWPAPPPKPPQAPISGTTVVLGTVLVGIVAAAIVLAVVEKSKGSTNSPVRSAAAFNACMKAAVQAEPAAAGDPDALNRDAQACAGHLPPGASVPRFRAAGDRSRGNRAAVQECMAQALAKVPRGLGASQSAFRQAFDNASAICRALDPGSGSAPGGDTTTDTIPSATVPPAKA
ncbi:MAG TPA: hypothetical protein VG265_13245 [Gaiellaceae bacterium]|nr:hypothetical protein [Gaiellaceae bacterium]